MWRDVGERGGAGARIGGGGGVGNVGNALALLLPTYREGKGQATRRVPLKQPAWLGSG